MEMAILILVVFMIVRNARKDKADGRPYTGGPMERDLPPTDRK